MKIQALALDIDGTLLLPDNTLGERTIKVLKKLMDRGVQIIICTGRAVEASETYRAAIGTEGPAVFFNGAEVIDMPSGKVLDTALVDIEIIDFCVDLARDMGIHFQIYLPAGTAGVKSKWETLVIEKNTPEAETYRRHTGIVPVVKDLKAVINAPGLTGCVKGMFICDPALHDIVREKLSARFGVVIYVAKTFPTFLEVMTAGVSKGAGLKTALKHRGIRAEAVLAAGDEENDLLMFKAAGFSAAPSNARESVRAAADFVFGSNAEEGLAAFLEEKAALF